MLKNKTGKAVKLAVLVPFAVLLAVLISTARARAPQTPASNQKPGAEERIEKQFGIYGLHATLDEKLAVEGDPAFVVQFAGDIHGSLEPCGCKGKVAGGLARRTGFLGLFDQRHQDLPRIVVDSGGFLSGDLSSHKMIAGYARVRDDFVFKAYQQFNVGAANVSARELPYLASLADRRLSPEFLGRLVSANVSPRPGVDLKLAPYVIKEIPDRGGAGKPIRVAFIGLSDPDPQSIPDFDVEDPIAAARRIVPEAKARSDIVIVLAHGSSSAAAAIAAQAPGIDVLIDGNGDWFTRSARAGHTLVVFTAYETSILGELLFFRDAEGGFSIKERYVGLDDAAPSDPAAAKLAADALAAVKSEVAQLTKELPSAVPSQKWSYSSALACVTCHQAEYAAWQNSAHARALTALSGQDANRMDTGCFNCHATGFGKGGFGLTVQQQQFSNVQCEACHGSATQHVAHPDKNYGRVDISTACAACHTAKTAPHFDAKAAWDQIKH